MIKTMKKVQEMKEKGNNLVIKHNSLLAAKSKHRYGKLELKLICNLVANITPYDKDFEDKKIPLKDLGFVDNNAKNYKEYDEAFMELMSKPFKIPGKKTIVNWFSAISVENGMVHYRFDKALKPFLMDLKGNFTKYRLKNILNLGSAYSIQIYELLAQMKNKGGRTIFIDDFREVLNIPNSYTNAHITTLLKKVQKDLEHNTDIVFKFAFEKEGRKFNKINFKIMHNKKVSKDEEKLAQQEQEYLEHLEALEEPTLQDNQQENLFNTFIDDMQDDKPKPSLKGSMASLRASNDI